MDNKHSSEGERFEIQPRVTGPQTIPAIDIVHIQAAVAVALERLQKQRVVTVTGLGGYVVHARLIGTQWRGEVMIMVSKESGTS